MSVFYHHTEMTPLLPRPIQRNDEILRPEKQMIISFLTI
jgi:hypothetical protein